MSKSTKMEPLISIEKGFDIDELYAQGRKIAAELQDDYNLSNKVREFIEAKNRETALAFMTGRITDFEHILAQQKFDGVMFGTEATGSKCNTATAESILASIEEVRKQFADAHINGLPPQPDLEPGIYDAAWMPYILSQRGGGKSEAADMYLALCDRPDVVVVDSMAQIAGMDECFMPSMPQGKPHHHNFKCDANPEDEGNWRRHTKPFYRKGRW